MQSTVDKIARAIDSAPAWSLVALTVGHARLRDDGRLELARHLAEALDALDLGEDQLTLPL